MTDASGPGSGLRRLELALHAAGLGEFEFDLDHSILSVSPRAAAITGFPVGETATQLGEMMERTAHPDDLQAFRAARVAALQSGETFDICTRIVRPADHATVWVRIAGVVARDATGRARRINGIAEDVSRRHLEEDTRQQLMAELDHRVKNVLAAVQALAVQKAKRTTSLDGFLTTFGGRLKAMASANELLTAARWRGAAIDHLAAAELGAIAPGQTGWQGPELFLTPRAANALSLALHELATNAVKFGALSSDTGHVDLSWSLRPDGGFEVVWTESGGPTVTPPTREGFGTTLLSQVTGRELNGETEVEYRPAGVRVRLTAGVLALAERPEVVPDAPVARVTETVATSRGPASLRGARVLIVEDAVLLALRIDAAVLDANLNGRSVTPVAELLAQRGVPFVFATGYGETGGAPGGFEAPVIRKPYDVTQVAGAVAELLGGR